MSFIAISEPDEPSARRSPRIVLIHDISGSIFSYTTLSMHPSLEPYSIYGMGAPEPGSGSDSFICPSSVSAWAKWYSDIILEGLSGMEESSESEAQVVLGGWSLGGLLAAEVARIFSRSGRVKVRGVVLLDTHAPWSIQTKAMTLPSSIASDTPYASLKSAGDSDAFLENGTPYFSPSDVKSIYHLLNATTRTEWPGMDDIDCPCFLVTPTKDTATMPCNGLEDWFVYPDMTTPLRKRIVRRIAEAAKEGLCDHFSMMEEEWIEEVGDVLVGILDDITSP